MSEAILSDNSIVCEKQQTKEWTLAKVIYIGLMAFNLLSFLWLLATGSGIEMPPIIWIARIATAPLAIYLGKLWKDRGFQILSAYFFLFFFQVLIPHPSNIFSAEMAESVFSALWLFAGCYGLGKILDGRSLKRFIRLIATIWTIGIVVYCGFGIYAAWTDQTIHSLGEGTFQLEGDVWYRLRLIYLSTTAGSILSVSALTMLILAITEKKIIGKILFSFATIITIITLALTDSRSACLSLSAGIAVFSFALVRHLFQRHRMDKTRSWIGWAAAILAMIIAFAVTFLLLMRVIPAFNALKTRGLMPAAYAEETEKAGKTLAQRGFHTEDIFSGRIGLWVNVWKHLTSGFRLLLFGESKIAPLQAVDPYFAHCHCLYIQVFLESGLFGLLLVTGFAVYLLICSIKGTETKNHPLWIKLLPAIPLSMLAGDTVESFIWLRSSQCPMNAVFFIAAGIITAQ